MSEITTPTQEYRYKYYDYVDLHGAVMFFILSVLAIFNGNHLGVVIFIDLFVVCSLIAVIFMLPNKTNLRSGRDVVMYAVINNLVAFLYALVSFGIWHFLLR